jgi:hypothetical protein
VQACLAAQSDREVMARVFAVMVEGLLVRAASRYKLNRAGNLSPVTKLIASRSALAV